MKLKVKMNIRKQTGITLIALVITIVVLLILVAVTMNAAFGENGLIKQVDTAKEKNEIAEYVDDLNRKMLSARVNVLNEETKILEEIKTLVSEDDKYNDATIIENDEDNKFTVITKEGYKIEVTKDGAIYGENAETDNVTGILKKYFLGESETGRPVYQIVDLSNYPNSYKFINEETTIADASTSVLPLNGNTGYMTDKMTELYFYAEYDNEAYEIKSTIPTKDYLSNNITTLNTVSVNKIILDEDAGKYVAYDYNNDGTMENWLILYNNEINGLQLISEKVLGNVQLGGSTASETIQSYNNAVDILNTACDQLIINRTAIQSVRNICSPLDKVDINEMATTSNYSNLGIWPMNNELYATGYGNNKGKDRGNYWKEDLGKLVALKIIQAKNEKNENADYWLASRFVRAEESDVSFGVQKAKANGTFDGTRLWDVESNDIVIYNTDINYGVRPVISLKPTAKLDKSERTGTSTDPYILTY